MKICLIPRSVLCPVVSMNHFLQRQPIASQAQICHMAVSVVCIQFPVRLYHLPDENREFCRNSHSPHMLPFRLYTVCAFLTGCHGLEITFNIESSDCNLNFNFSLQSVPIPIWIFTCFHASQTILSLFDLINHMWWYHVHGLLYILFPFFCLLCLLSSLMNIIWGLYVKSRVRPTHSLADHLFGSHVLQIFCRASDGSDLRFILFGSAVVDTFSISPS